MPPLRIELHPEAEDELDEAVGRYEAERRGVGLRFAAAVSAALDRLAAAPDLGPRLAPGVRRLLVPGFPYGIVYAPEPERLFVVAVAHGRRRPGYWRRRR